MERSTVTGNQQKAASSKQKAEDPRRNSFLPSARCLLPTAVRGFTLLELMIVITIIIILAAIALPQYQKSVKQAKEAVLIDDLRTMRTLIDQYAADKGKLPQSLDELASSGYMREVPIDPFTDNKDWSPTTGEDPNSNSGEQGLTDVHSTSPETGSDGKPYSEY
jgi:general secretion pathway protein G